WASQAQRFSKGDRWLRRDDARVAAQSLGKTRTEENVLDLSRRTQRTRRIFKCLCDLGFSRRGSTGWLKRLRFSLLAGHRSLVTSHFARNPLGNRGEDSSLPNSRQRFSGSVPLRFSM